MYLRNLVVRYSVAKTLLLSRLQFQQWVDVSSTTRRRRFSSVGVTSGLNIDCIEPTSLTQRRNALSPEQDYILILDLLANFTHCKACLEIGILLRRKIEQT